MRIRKLALLGGSLAAMLIVLQTTPGIRTYIEAVQTGRASYTAAVWPDDDEAAMPVFASGEAVALTKADSVLLETIREEAAKRRIAPIDAKLDPVWKAIPGYNGLEVDVDETFRLAQQRLLPGAISYVMKETEPKVQLKDLGAVPVYRGNPHKPMASLMINVAWGNEYLPSILETLRKEGVHATFFLDGMWLNKNAEAAKQILSAGHELSNHAYSHKDMRTISRSKTIEEITKTETLLKKLGVANTLFAPPSGYFNEMTVQVASDMKLQTVLWTLDTVDWKKPQPSWIIDRIAKNVEPGSLILMHPTESSSRALPSMIQAIKSKGLQLGTVSELLSSNRVTEPTKAGS
ncbi:polysaccharide deacetylase family protein [Paenibacillus athensensis]|uniref:NodB homology domain-containing protein n=1 Tax=Paenibacillus athensensis TaxID=1967502 RepID=A0A4Y8Q9Z5_9BACL|nr:polysaccharide deacetylase family protein [Paenibacillus athensensis]MCD1257768.1 polysaccharide deacetylase family protein [Paenibacillus athensensis]